MDWQIYDRDGKIAVTDGWQRDYTNPQDVRISYVNGALTEEYQNLIGRPIEFLGGASLIGNVVVNFQDWPQVVDSQPVKKPRRGKWQGMPYDWEWDTGRWRRIWA